MMYRDELATYCERHGYKVLDVYETPGAESHSNVRALVRTSTGEQHRLYYDPSRKRRSLTQQRKDLEAYKRGEIPPMPRARGWRNATLDRRRSLARRVARHEAEQEQEYLDSVSDMPASTQRHGDDRARSDIVF